MWWLLFLPVAQATLFDFEWDAAEPTLTLNACLDTTINITWAGNYNIMETENAGCSSGNILSISDGENAGHVQTFNIMGAAPGMTRYFKDTNNCQDAGGGFGRFQTYCPPAGAVTTGPDDDFSCAAGLPDAHDCAGGLCVDTGCAAGNLGSASHTLLSGGANEYCNDFAPLGADGYYPPVLQSGDNLYNADKEVECRSRCLDQCSSYESFYLLEFDGDTNQSLNTGGYGGDERRCACGSGDCSVRSAGEAGNIYSSYAIDNPNVNQYQCTCASSSNPSDDGSNGGIWCINGQVSGASDMFSAFHACSCLCDAGVTGVGCEILPAPEPEPATAPAANPSAPAPSAQTEESSTGLRWWHVILLCVALIGLGRAFSSNTRPKRYFTVPTEP